MKARRVNQRVQSSRGGGAARRRGPSAGRGVRRPFDFVREDEARDGRDVNVPLDALPTPPGGTPNSRRSCENARSLPGFARCR